MWVRLQFLTQYNQEVRCMMKCKQNGVATPSIYLVDESKGRIYFEYVTGSTLKEFLQDVHAKGWFERAQSDLDKAIDSM